MLIGVLKHSKYGHAEKRIKENAELRKHQVIFINPFSAVVGINPFSMILDGLSVYCDVIISRCEIRAAHSPECDAYFRLLDIYENKGVPIINSKESIIACQDKFRTHVLLQEGGIPNPRTFVGYTENQVMKIMNNSQLEYPVIVKELYGSRGEGVNKIDNKEELRKRCQKFDESHPILVQEFLDKETNKEGEVRDMRIWVYRNPETRKPKFFGAVYRNARGGNFLTNISQGGYVSPIEEYDPRVIEMSERALDLLHADVAGVDIARTKSGKYFLEEVNISFDTGPKTEEILGNIWEQVILYAESLYNL